MTYGRFAPAKALMKGNIWRIYLFRMLLMSMCFAIPTLVNLWSSCGMSMTQVMLLQAIFAVATTILETPTGYIADILGRKFSLLGAAIAYLIGGIAYVLAPSFEWFVVAEIILACGISLASGADQALLYDTLESEGRSAEFGNIWGSVRACEFWMNATAYLVGGFVVTLGARAPLILGVCCYIAAIVIALGFVEPVRSRSNERARPLRDLTQILREAFVKNTRLGWLTIITAMIFGTQVTNLWLYQPYFKEAHIPEAYNGVVFAFFGLFAGLIARKASLIERALNARAALVAVGLTTVVTPLLLGLFVHPLGFLVILPQQFARGLVSVTVDDYRNKLIGGEFRATHASIQSMINRAFCCLLMIPAGQIADSNGNGGALLALALAGSVMILGMLIFERLRFSEASTQRHHQA